jgi:hypothetical protein
MANTKISQLPTFTGDTTGAYIVMDNSSLTETFKVPKETLFSGYSTNVVSPVSGSWTVTPGTNNYSFTVDINNTYNLWVLGNIPNGIIVYNATVSVSNTNVPVIGVNATVSVSNTNVPVIGVQYAWNYTGGSSPILFTSIPVQIIGTAGAISTASPAVGTSTNTFVFGIQNNTVSGLTVNYGYVKVS